VKAEDPLPLRKAKLNQEASVRKSEKSKKIAEEKAEAAKVAKAQAEVHTHTLHTHTIISLISCVGGS
jgi:hypothetical protein